MEAAESSWKIWKDVEPEEEEELIKRAADLVERHKIEPIALLVLNTVKPLVYVGGEMSRFFIAPLLPFLDHKADALIHTFEQRENIDELISIIEKRMEEEDENKRKESAMQATEEANNGTTKKRKWWPF